MPWPSSISRLPGSLPIDTSFSISVSGAGASDPRVQYAIQRTFTRLSRQTGVPILPHVVHENATLSIAVEQRDHKSPQRLGDDEQYSFEVANGHARLSADHPLGVLRGLETFLQLVLQNTAPASPGFSVPGITIHDQPRFPWRGLSLDVSRHFIPLDGLKRTVDGVAAVKLNVLHWHLSDDQGFRIESKRYPRLQQYGSDGLFYTQTEVREIVAYARDRGIRIVPEFDVPGHATSWLPGYPVLGAGSGKYEIVRGSGVFNELMDPTKESTYRFLDGFIGEMAKLFPDEYFHIGGDEVDATEWLHNPRILAFMRRHHIADGKALQVYFNQRLLKIIAKHGKHMEGWDEVLQPNLPKSIVIQSWRGQQSLWQAAREGYQGILSAGYYLDLMYPASYHYSVDPMKWPPPEPAHQPKPGAEAAGTPANLTLDQQKLILGGEAAMWEEIATSENLDAKLWPRLAAIAERFWSPAPIVDVASMYGRLQATNRWLEWLGLTQRSNLELMRQRLAGMYPVQPLNIFASILEPVKHYARDSRRYNIFSSFHLLVDAIPPESDTAREFRNSVDQYIEGPKGPDASSELRKQLAIWSDNATAIRPMLSSNSLLNEDVSITDAIVALCKIGQDAIAAIDSGAHASFVAPKFPPERIADVLIQITPAIHKLVDAVPQPESH